MWSLTFWVLGTQLISLEGHGSILGGQGCDKREGSKKANTGLLLYWAGAVVIGLLVKGKAQGGLLSTGEKMVASLQSQTHCENYVHPTFYFQFEFFKSFIYLNMMRKLNSMTVKNH